ncbi:hypothetical protein SAY86_023909 [Trapa natans]|uniref:Malonyl-CoA decarboxylase n=1 Tax=Trapa natans TaxID=22666 RepID=A0AAN7R674_TRANT|nr:hypothetical protein SAY86_023909 [Trapa natans]
MNKKGLAILMRTRMKPGDPRKLALLPHADLAKETTAENERNESPGCGMKDDGGEGNRKLSPSSNKNRTFEQVKESMHSAISMNKAEFLDAVLSDFSEGYFDLSLENRRKLLLVLAREYDLNRVQVRQLINQYIGLELPKDDGALVDSAEEEGLLSTFYRIERNLSHALKPVYEVLFERLNTHPGGLKFLVIMRADILFILTEGNVASLRALDSYLKVKLSTLLSPAALEIHQITWNDPASLLEKIVAYEAVHPISNLVDLKRRLGVGRRCFGYFHSAIPSEPLIFIEVALLNNVAQNIQEVLWDDPPIPENEATCALFYSISSTQPGLAGINLGKFLIKRAVTLLKREMAQISTFATLSPIPGFMSWLLSKLGSQSKLAEIEALPHSSTDGSASSFWENILKPEEERAFLSLSGPGNYSEFGAMKNGMEVMLHILTSKNLDWKNPSELQAVLKPALMRLCARYLLKEKKRGKALDSVANFHLQNGAMVQRINWMADLSEKGFHQSGGIMVNYIYRLDNIEEYAQSYFSTGHIQASTDLLSLLETV